MERVKPLIQWETLSGEATTVGDIIVTPQSRHFSIRLPFGAFVWNRPAAIVVERNGQSERIAIVDVTRIILWSIMGLSFAITLFAWLTRRRRSQTSTQDPTEEIS